MRILILCLSVFVVTGAFAQTTIKEKREYTENGITRGWVITKELDMQGNLFDYDSSYYEKKADPSDFGGDFGFSDEGFKGLGDMPDFGSDMPMEFPEIDQFTQSMLNFTDAMMRMTDSIMGRFMGPEGFSDFDKYIDGFGTTNPDMPDRVEPKKKELIIPDKQKKKNKRT